MKRWPLLVLLLALGACRNPCVPYFCDDRSVLILPAGAEPGAFAIGVVEGTTPSAGTHRGLFGPTTPELRVTAWYPSDDPGEAEPFCYDEIYPGDGLQSPPAACERPRPVVLYSHGNGSIRWAGSYFSEHLASHGYLVAAPDHTHNTFFDLDSSTEGFRDVMVRRPLDLRATFDFLVAESADPESALFGCVDPDAGYAIIGHSFGGYTALATGGWTLTPPEREAVDHGDPRVWAVMTLAPWDADGTLAPDNDDLAVPVLTLAAELDETLPIDEVLDLHASIDSRPRTLGLMPRAGHYTYAPIGCANIEDADGCGDAFLDLEEAAGLITNAARLFLDEARGASEVPVTSLESEELLWETAP